ncbi:hypothetical protein OW786_25785, partial [Klebsiella pneumoniae]
LTYRKPIMLFISLVAGTQPKKIKGSCRDKGKLGHSLCNLMMLLGFKYFSVLPFLVPSLAVYAEAFAFP